MLEGQWSSLEFQHLLAYQHFLDKQAYRPMQQLREDEHVEGSAFGIQRHILL